MKIVTVIIASMLSGGAGPAIPDADGWVPVERPDPRPSERDEEERKDIWVVFSKNMDGEKFTVRMPEDPSYRYFPGGMQLDSATGEDAVRLTVEKRGEKPIEKVFQDKLESLGSAADVLLLKAEKSGDGAVFELFYRQGEKWVWEKVRAESQFLYTFRTESPEMSGRTHRIFSASLGIF